MAKRTRLIVILLALTLLVWNPAHEMRSSHRQFAACVEALAILPAAGAIVIGRVKSILLHQDLKTCFNAKPFQVLRI